MLVFAGAGGKYENTIKNNMIIANKQENRHCPRCEDEVKIDQQLFLFGDKFYCQYCYEIISAQKQSDF